MRRKPGTLLPLEIALLQAAVEFVAAGDPEFYGYSVARAISQREGARQLTSHGTLYKALDRLRKSGFLESRWEDPEKAALEERPRRRLYHITAEGQRALQVAEEAPAPTMKGAFQPS